MKSLCNCNKMRDRRTLPIVDDFDRLFSPEGWCVISCKICDYVPLISAKELREHCEIHSSTGKIENKNSTGTVAPVTEAVTKNDPTSYDDHAFDGDFDDLLEPLSNDPPAIVESTSKSFVNINKVTFDNGNAENEEKYVIHSCSMCHTYFLSDDEYRNHVQHTHAKTEFKPLSLPDKEPSSVILKKRILFHVASGEIGCKTSVSCSQCPEIFLSLDELTDHVINQHVKEDVPDDEEEDIPEPECEENDTVLEERLMPMKKKFLAEVKQVKYKLNHSLESKTCKICGVVCWSPTYLKNRHMPQYHPDPNKPLFVPCEYCDMQVKNNSTSMNWHRSKYHRDKTKKYKVNEVNRVFNTKKTMPKRTIRRRRVNPIKENHPEWPEWKRYGYSETPWLCSYCSFQTHYKISFENHVRIQHESHLEKNKDKIYKCKYCDHQTMHQSNIKHHQFVQHEYKMGINTHKAHVCSYCGFTTPDLNIYNDHVRHVHEGVKRKKRPPRKRKK